jgi:hypothetical protein
MAGLHQDPKHTPLMTKEQEFILMILLLIGSCIAAGILLGITYG